MALCSLTTPSLAFESPQQQQQLVGQRGGAGHATDPHVGHRATQRRAGHLLRALEA